MATMLASSMPRIIFSALSIIAGSPIMADTSAGPRGGPPAMAGPPGPPAVPGPPPIMLAILRARAYAGARGCACGCACAGLRAARAPTVLARLPHAAGCCRPRPAPPSSPGHLLRGH